MINKESIYRKNFSLIITLIVLVSAALVAALLISYNLTRKYVENEFDSNKIDVLEKTMQSYDEFFSNKIPQITAYQGFLTEASASKYANSVFTEYPFVKSIDFYHLDISNHKTDNTFNNGDLSVGIHNIFKFLPLKGTSLKHSYPVNEKSL